MKRYLILVLILLSCIIANQAKAFETFTLCYEDQDYPPYLIGESETPASPNPGLLVELTQKAFTDAGLEVFFIRRPWKRCMRMVEANEAAGMFGVIYSKEREKVGAYPMIEGKPDPSRRLLSVEYPIFQNKNNPVKWDGSSFLDSQIKLATPLGYQTAQTLKNKYNITPNTTYLPEAGLLLVALNKLDGYIVEKNVGLSILKKNKLEGSVIPSSPVFKKHDLYLLLSHGFHDTHTKDAERVWDNLTLLRKTLLHELLKAYR